MRKEEMGKNSRVLESNERASMKTSMSICYW